nr:RNA-directed DNA polymerase, eukaryota [Tanacetum cinerariifolium]
MKILNDLKAEQEKSKQSESKISVGLSPPPELATFGLTAEEKKRKRTELIIKVFVTENVKVDGMDRNLIPPPRIMPIQGLVINEPKRIQVTDIVNEVEDYLKTRSSAGMDMNWPIILREIHADFGPTPFRMYHSWFIRDGFDDMIRQIDNGNVTDDLLLKRLEVSNKLFEEKNLDTKDAAQKAKVRWAIEGDENLKFFHGIINKRRSQLAIRGVFVNGVWLTDPGSVKLAFHDHFADRFKQPTSTRFKINT